MLEALQFEFMRNALMAGLLASVLCGVMGTLVVVNRIVFLSGGIAHAAYGGIGLAFFLGWPFLQGLEHVICLPGSATAGAAVHGRSVPPDRADPVCRGTWFPACPP